MFKRLAWLWVAMMLVSSGLAHAQPDTADSRHMAPDEFQSQTVKILRTTNKAQTQSYVPVVFTMRNNNPFNVIRFLHRPIQTEEGSLYTFVSPEGNGGKVLYVVPEYMVESLRALVAAVDRPGLTSSSGDMRIYRQLSHRRASLTDPGFIETAASFSTGNGSDLLVDPWANALFWEDAPSGSITLDNALTDFLDVPTAMAQIVISVYELNATNDAQIGLDYMAWKNGPGRELFALGAYDEYASFGRDTNMRVYPGSLTDQGQLGLPRRQINASGWNYAWNYNVDSSFFDFLAVKGKARIMNKAKIAMLNTWPASFSAGDQVLYYAVDTDVDPYHRVNGYLEPRAPGVRDSGQVFQSNEGRTVIGTTNERISSTRLAPVETGFFLDIDNVIGEQSITLSLDMEWSDYNAFDDSGFPQINDRSLAIDDVRLALGDEIVIGGMKRQVNANSTEKVPFLGSIPILGYAFGGESSQNKQTELVVAIKAIGITQYDMAMMDEADKTVIEQVRGNVAIEEPATSAGFDQWLLDDQIKVPVVDFE